MWMISQYNIHTYLYTHIYLNGMRQGKSLSMSILIPLLKQYPSETSTYCHMYCEVFPLSLFGEWNILSPVWTLFIIVLFSCGSPWPHGGFPSHFRISMWPETWEDPSADLWSSGCAALSSLAFCLTNSSFLGLPRGQSVFPSFVFLLLGIKILGCLMSNTWTQF